jgi:glycosyltransferase involved in cell wall biosynthesis
MSNILICKTRALGNVVRTTPMFYPIPHIPASLAEAINTILSNALERFKEFEIDLIADKVLNLYQEVLKC